MALSAGTSEVWPALQTQIAASLLAVAVTQSPAPLLPAAGNSGSFRPVITGQDTEVR